MENYSLLMGDSGVDEDGGGDGAVSMEKPSGGTSPSVACGAGLMSPDLGRDGGGSGRFLVPWLFRIEDLENLVEANKRVDSLARKLEQSEKARKKAEADAKKDKADVAAVEDLRQKLHEAETALSDNISEQAVREAEILSRLQSQSRCFVRKTHQDFDLECPEGDQLLDKLSLLEFHGEEAREGLAKARAGLSRLFPYFFLKKEEPKIFTNLAKCFNSQEDLGLKLRQEGLKIGVEGTITLVANSQQDVDWAKVGNIKEMETKKWQSLIKAVKPNSKPILSFLGCKLTPAPSSSKPEVK
ncbi:hypothetical protein QYE76_033852 [Lolium multiflorum]|uniref:Uncharacterized protein n=1 Tax=Lolium multiflorum TaxID=4521 RepID=A0AAD8QYE8_LOLMU|nr:hypothetical protein QYE76_033852 [Lolium multiflorum]